MLRGPAFIVYRESYSAAMSVVGLSPGGMLAIGLPLSPGKETKYWKQTHGESSCALALPGPLDVTWDHTHEQIVALIDLQALQASVTEREFKHLIRLAQGNLSPASFKASLFTLNRALTSCEIQPAMATSPSFLADTYDKIVLILTLITQANLKGESGEKPSETLALRASSG